MAAMGAFIMIYKARPVCETFPRGGHVQGATHTSYCGIPMNEWATNKEWKSCRERRRGENKSLIDVSTKYDFPLHLACGFSINYPLLLTFLNHFQPLFCWLPPTAREKWFQHCDGLLWILSIKHLHRPTIIILILNLIQVLPVLESSSPFGIGKINSECCTNIVHIQ